MYRWPFLCTLAVAGAAILAPAAQAAGRTDGPPPAPGFGAIAIPDSAVVGQEAGFAAAPTSRLDGATLHWDFGDGSSADGTIVHHTYTASGRMTVTVTTSSGAKQSRVVAVSATPRTDARTHPPAHHRRHKHRHHHRTVRSRTVKK